MPVDQGPSVAPISANHGFPLGRFGRPWALKESLNQRSLDVVLALLVGCALAFSRRLILAIARVRELGRGFVMKDDTGHMDSDLWGDRLASEGETSLSST